MPGRASRYTSRKTSGSCRFFATKGMRSVGMSYVFSITKCMYRCTRNGASSDEVSNYRPIRPIVRINAIECNDGCRSNGWCRGGPACDLNVISRGACRVDVVRVIILRREGHDFNKLLVLFLIRRFRGFSSSLCFCILASGRTQAWVWNRSRGRSRACLTSSLRFTIRPFFIFARSLSVIIRGTWHARPGNNGRRWCRMGVVRLPRRGTECRGYSGGGCASRHQRAGFFRVGEICEYIALNFNCLFAFRRISRVFARSD